MAVLVHMPAKYRRWFSKQERTLLDRCAAEGNRVFVAVEGEIYAWGEWVRPSFTDLAQWTETQTNEGYAPYIF
jgi:hypothetical protein